MDGWWVYYKAGLCEMELLAPGRFAGREERLVLMQELRREMNKIYVSRKRDTN